LTGPQPTGTLHRMIANGLQVTVVWPAGAERD
jgi:hypothetical protein